MYKYLAYVNRFNNGEFDEDYTFGSDNLNDLLNQLNDFVSAYEHFEGVEFQVKYHIF